MCLQEKSLQESEQIQKFFMNNCCALNLHAFNAKNHIRQKSFRLIKAEDKAGVLKACRSKNKQDFLYTVTHD